MTQSVVDRWRPSQRTVGPRQWRFAGTAAAVVVAVTSWLCGATPKEYSSVWPGVIPWRSNGGSPLACSLLFIAVGVMLYAWWAVRDLDLSVGWHVRTALLWFAPLLVSAPLFSRDVFSYAVQGLMLHQGLDPYHHGVRGLASPWVSSVSRVWLDTTVPYGPLFMVVAWFAAAVSGGSLLVALGLLRLGATACVLVLAWAVPVIARRLGTDPVRAVWLGFLTPLVGMHLVAGAHNDALMIAGMVAAVALALQGRHALACLAIAAAMAVKAPAAVAMPFVAILAAVDDRGAAIPRLAMPRLVLRTLVAGAASCAAFVAISLATGLGFSWVNSLSEPGKSIQWTSLPTGIGMGIGFVGTLFGHNVEDGAVAVARTVALVVLGVALVWIWVRALRRAQDRRFVVVCAAQALVAFIVLSPAFHAWYLLWALPLFAASVTDRRWQTVLAGFATLMSVSILPGGYSLGLVTSWVGVPLCFVALGAGVVYGWRWIQARRSPET